MKKKLAGLLLSLMLVAFCGLSLQACSEASPSDEGSRDQPAAVQPESPLGDRQGLSAEGDVSSDGSADGAASDGLSAAGSDAVSADSSDGIPAYDGADILQVNGGEPVFSEEELSSFGVEEYFPLDALARATGAFAVVGLDTMPTEERGSIGMVKPSGWHIARYDFIDGSYLYNRCHLIGFQLTGENANDRNLITGTRFLNVDLMLPYENAVADYVERTGNHVAYRATPHYDGDDLVASAVQLEALSIEDDGAGVRINMLLYNVQPGVSIDYATGKSCSDGSIAEVEGIDESDYDYIVNISSNKFHRPDCSSVDDMKEENKLGFTGTREKAIELGYEPCGRCKP